MPLALRPSEAPDRAAHDPPQRVQSRSGGAEIDLRAHAADVGPVRVVERLDRVQLRRARWAAVVLLALLNAADLLTTRAFLAAGVPEANPIAAALITTGWLGFVKAGVILGLGLRVLHGRPTLPTTCALYVVVGIYAAVVAVNLLTLGAL